MFWGFEAIAMTVELELHIADTDPCGCVCRSRTASGSTSTTTPLSCYNWSLGVLRGRRPSDTGFKFLREIPGDRYFASAVSRKCRPVQSNCKSCKRSEQNAGYGIEICDSICRHQRAVCDRMSQFVQGTGSISLLISFPTRREQNSPR